MAPVSLRSTFPAKMQSLALSSSSVASSSTVQYSNCMLPPAPIVPITEEVTSAVDVAAPVRVAMAQLSRIADTWNFTVASAWTLVASRMSNCPASVKVQSVKLALGWMLSAPSVHPWA